MGLRWTLISANSVRSCRTSTSLMELILLSCTSSTCSPGKIKLMLCRFCSPTPCSCRFRQLENFKKEKNEIELKFCFGKLWFRESITTWSSIVFKNSRSYSGSWSLILSSYKVPRLVSWEKASGNITEIGFSLRFNLSKLGTFLTFWRLLIWFCCKLSSFSSIEGSTNSTFSKSIIWFPYRDNDSSFLRPLMLDTLVI